MNAEEILVEEPPDDLPAPERAPAAPLVEEPEPDGIDVAMRTLTPKELDGTRVVAEAALEAMVDQVATPRQAPRRTAGLSTFTPPAAAARTIAELEAEASAALGIPSRSRGAVPSATKPERTPVLSTAPRQASPAATAALVPTDPDGKEKSQQQQQAEALLARARALPVTTAEEHAAAGDLLKQITALEERIVTFWQPLTDAAHKAWKKLTGVRGEVLLPVQEARRIVAQKFGAYDIEQRRLADEARRKAEEAERTRRQRELEEEAAALERKVATAVTSDVAVEASTMAAVLRQEAAALPPPVVDAPAPAVATVAGVSVRDNWDAEVYDLKELVHAVSRGEAPLSFLEPNQSALRLRAKAEKDAMRVPGVRAINKAGAATRRR